VPKRRIRSNSMVQNQPVSSFASEFFKKSKRFTEPPDNCVDSAFDGKGGQAVRVDPKGIRFLRHRSLHFVPDLLLQSVDPEIPKHHAKCRRPTTSFRSRRNLPFISEGFNHFEKITVSENRNYTLSSSVLPSREKFCLYVDLGNTRVPSDTANNGNFTGKRLNKCLQNFYAPVQYYFFDIFPKKVDIFQEF